MTSKHTPPPWFVHDFRGASNEPSVHDITVSCDHPATLTVCYMGKALHGTEEEALANAHLIAAAPEIHEALKVVRRYIYHDGEWQIGWNLGRIDEILKKI